MSVTLQNNTAAACKQEPIATAMHIHSLELQTKITGDRSNTSNYHIPTITKTMGKAW